MSINCKYVLLKNKATDIYFILKFENDRCYHLTEDKYFSFLTNYSSYSFIEEIILKSENIEIIYEDNIFEKVFEKLKILRVFS